MPHKRTSSTSKYEIVPQLLCFVLHDKSSQTVFAALHEKDAEDHE
jgi:hypothetical protein